MGARDFQFLLPRLCAMRQKRPEPVHIEPGIIGFCKKQPEREARRTAGADSDASRKVDFPACDFFESRTLEMFLGRYRNVFEIRQAPNVSSLKADVPEKFPIKGDVRGGMLNEAPEPPRLEVFKFRERFPLIPQHLQETENPQSGHGRLRIFNSKSRKADTSGYLFPAQSC